MVPSPAERAKAEGSLHLKCGHYRKAVDALTRGLSEGPNMALLTMRCKAYKEWGNFKAALLDAKAMIQLQRSEPHGYIYAVQLLVEMQRVDPAVATCALGLRDVPVTHHGYKRLEKLRDYMNAMRPVESKLGDPSVHLPMELFLEVVSYLEFHEIASCVRISARWRDVLSSAPNLWRDLDFRAASKKPVKASFVSSAVQNAEGTVTIARLRKVYDERILRLIATVCKDLRTMELHEGRFSGESVIECAQLAYSLTTLRLSRNVTITVRDVTKVFKFRPAIAVAEFGDVQTEATVARATWTAMPNLHTLRFGNNVSPEDNNRSAKANLNGVSLDRLFPSTPNLKHFSLEGWQYSLPTSVSLAHLQLDALIIKRCNLRIIDNIPATLRRLSVVRCGFHHPPLFRQNMPFLEDLEISLVNFDAANAEALVCNAFPIWQEAAVPAGAPSVIWRFHISDCSWMGINQLKNMLRSERVLQAQDISLRNTSIDDGGLQSVIRLMPNLRRLDLTDTKITGSSVGKVLLAIPNLQFLDVSHCSGISSETLEWARRRCPVVRHHPPGHSSSRR
ncbi:hypothetical protein EJ06DRAFT_581029 [Trichodelitschia bisporula]|uniref:F-box domain-containing protein n=1 Tax=Trichodelitschia bisporula TaxID=703511 RepID=A0A6G1I0T2_9PEZI|nr:hypothetical protein EJ06DRAFT_581029 [Trichodelitschia bisporula]